MPEAKIGRPITGAPVDRMELTASYVRGDVGSSAGGVTCANYECFADDYAEPAIVKGVIGCSCFDLE